MYTVMEDDEAVRKLVELIFTKKCPHTTEEIPPDSSLPDNLLTNDFWWRIRYVLFMRQFAIKSRWKRIFNSIRHTMLSSHHKYLYLVMSLCLCETSCNPDIFDSFINVCCLVRHCNSETLKNVGVNFCDLNSEIVIEFYLNVLKKSFSKHGGFRGLVEYIRHHKYLAWKWYRNDLLSPNDTASSVNDETAKKLREEIVGGAKFHISGQLRKSLSERESSILAKTVILTTSVELPTLPSREELIKKEVASRKNKIAEEGKDMDRFQIAAELEAIEEIRNGCSRSNSDSVTKNVAEAIEDFSRCENIIQAVIAHNLSRTSVLVNTNDSIEKKANRILEHWKDRIKRLIEVLDEYDKE